MDFDKIAADVRIHFCPECKASFGCETDEDGDCCCIGCNYNWSKPWCPICVERKEDENCNCLGKRADGSGHHNQMCPAYVEPPEENRLTTEAIREASQKEIDQYYEAIRTAIRKDLDKYIGRKLREL